MWIVKKKMQYVRDKLDMGRSGEILWNKDHSK